MGLCGRSTPAGLRYAGVGERLPNRTFYFFGDMTNDEFRRHRESFGFSQFELAGLLGMWRQGVTRIESGERQMTKKDVASMYLLVAAHKIGVLPQLIEAIKK